MGETSLRALDHCVLPVQNLALARERYRALGFTVAPQGTHPFGTVNACVYFSDDTFLEPLAVDDQGAVEQAICDGNMFVGRDAIYRRGVGGDGFSALVFKTDDARADHAMFLAAGISAGSMLDFSRAFVDPAGKSGKVSFRLAFAADRSSEASYFFTCQRIDAPSADGRAALEAHANGVRRIAGITLTAERPHDHQHFLEALTGAPVERMPEGLMAKLPNARLFLAPGKGALSLSSIHFAVDDLAVTEAALRAGDVQFSRIGNALSIDPAPGQGAIFLFEAAP